ncbi:MAG: haloacid dehalogenase type II [Gammaproteobacteria bacterium]
MSGTDIRALVFDTFGTVVDWRGGIVEACRELGEARGINADWDRFADAWRGKYGPFMDKVRKGTLPWTNLDALHRMGLDELLVEFGIDGLGEQDKMHLNLAWHRLRGWPDAVPGLTRLKRRYVIAPMSNGTFALLTNMAKYAGLPWDCILSTELAHCYKPDAEAYRLAPDLLQLAPESIVMVAAHPYDLRSAAKIGLRTAYVARPLEMIASHADAARALAQVAETNAELAREFDYVVNDFLELATLLGT